MKTLFLTTLMKLIGISAFAQSAEEGRYIGIHSGYGILSSSLSGS